MLLKNNSYIIIKITPTEINTSAKLNINQWKLPTWKSIKSGTALNTIRSYRLPIAPPKIIIKEYFFTPELFVIIKPTKIIIMNIIIIKIKKT